MTAGYDGRPVAVTGAGVSGAAAARVLRDLGASVTVVDADAEALEALAAQGFPVGTGLPDELDLVVTSPGWRPSAPLLVEAAARGVEVIGEVELAWRLRGPGAAPWLALTGTNGKTTTVKMLESVLRGCRDLPLLLLCEARPEFLGQCPGWGGGIANVTIVERL